MTGKDLIKYSTAEYPATLLGRTRYNNSFYSYSNEVYEVAAYFAVEYVTRSFPVIPFN